MNTSYFVAISIILLLFGCIYFCNSRSIRKLHVWAVVLAYIIVVIVIYKFIIASGGFTNIIDKDYWGSFGSFIGAFLLASTLLFQIRSFRRQQVESKFFELIKYYRDNITEMRFRNPFYYKDGEREVDEEYLQGRRVLKTIFEQYKVARKICHFKNLNTKCHYSSDGISKIGDKWQKAGFDRQKEDDSIKLIFDSSEWEKKYCLNEIAYQITFWGIPHGVDVELNKYIKNLYSEKSIDEGKDLFTVIRKIVTVWEFSGKKGKFSGLLKNNEIKKIDDIIEISEPQSKVKFFGGHQYHLGHYFRHLYQAVKYIDNQPSWLMSKKDKYDYVKTLRAQMSNYEQGLLFINSLTKLGRKWEYDNEEKNFISDYNLIKNLPENFIPYMKPQYYYPDVDFEWMEKEKK